jgi:hypothetical protein
MAAWWSRNRSDLTWGLAIGIIGGLIYFGWLIYFGALSWWNR